MARGGLVLGALAGFACATTPPTVAVTVPADIEALLELYGSTAVWQSRRNELDGELERMARECPQALLPYLDDTTITAVTTRHANFRITQFPNVRVWELIDSALARVHEVREHYFASDAVRFWSQFEFPR